MSARLFFKSFLISVFFFSAPLHAESRLDWLQLDDMVLSHYELRSTADSPQRLTLKTKALDENLSGYRKVLGLIPSASVVAYSTTINTFTSEFTRAGEALELELWYYDSVKEEADQAIKWAEENDFDLVLTIGSSAAKYAYKNYQNGHLPVVTAAAKDPVLRGQMPDYESGSGTNIAYTSINVPIRTLNAYLTQLLPNLKNIAVLYDNTNDSAIETQVTPLVAFAETADYQILKLAVQSPDTVLTDLRAIMPEAIARMRKTDPELKSSLFLLTGSTSVYQEIRLVNALSDGLPVVALLPDVVREGDDSAVVSIGSTMAATVRLSSHYALQILRGVSAPGDLKVGFVSPPEIAISFRKARQIGLKIPFRFMEQASFIYDYEGHPVRINGQLVESRYQ
ncbi:ABC transporter substrate-binding protein [Aestuariispira insulae]|uniref:Putative ABC transport system substrate-binding protein n=1 Tax=Aestuariispira insulae TaxID=1461337 RepID=A0A3D9HUQ8_9PROT|nr:ABC transporter substrate binding protein [Aestuariispira insulae]RED53232.1 putative ABC transport system substrate-binding protein [Aestuariispira insulae]